MRILLIRHGESHANVDSGVHKIIPDHEIALSSRGVDQAKRAGEYVKAYFEKEYSDLFDENISAKDKMSQSLEKMISESEFGKNKAFSDIFKNLVNQMGSAEQISEHITPNIKLYHSPSKKNKETSNIIKNKCNTIKLEISEEILLYNGISNLNDSNFWIKQSSGESIFDISIRLKIFLNQLKYDEEDGVKDFIIVCDNIVGNLIAKLYINNSPFGYEKEKEFGNSSIRILNNRCDVGCVLAGYVDGCLIKDN